MDHKQEQNTEIDLKTIIRTRRTEKNNKIYRTRTDQNPCKNPTRSYPNNRITMLRTTAAGKAAAGPLNTSDSEIATNLNF